MGVITAWPFSSKRGEEGVLDMHRVFLTFPFCLSIKCPPVKHALWWHSKAAAQESQPSSWRELNPVRKSHTWRAQEGRLSSFHLLRKRADRCLLSPRTSLPPGLHRPQPDQQSTHQNSIMAISGLVAWETGRSITVTKDCCGLLHH